MNCKNAVCTKTFWVELITMLYHICYAMIEPSIKVHIYEALCSTGNLTIDCSTATNKDRISIALEDAVQKYAANSLVYLKLMRSLPALLIILFCGAWSDNIGRKLPILFPFIGMAFSLLLYLISYAHGVDVYSLILAGGFASGLFGEVGLIMMAGYSYITDMTEISERTNRLGRLMAMMFFGQFLGSLIVGLMIEATLVRNILIFALLINCLSIIVIVTFLQDSLSDKSTTVLLFRPTYLVETWQVIAKPREERKRLYIALILTCIALHQACLWGEFDITMLYVRHKPLWWNASKYGYYLAGGSFASGLGTILLLPILSGRFNVPDFSLVLSAVAFKVLQMVWSSFSSQDWMVFLGLPMMIVSSMFVPALKSVLSKLITEDEVGKIFGLSAFGETIAGLLGALIFTSVYGAAVHLWKGFAFILEAVVNVGVFVVIFWVARKYKSPFMENIGIKKEPLTVRVTNNDFNNKQSANFDTQEFTSLQYEEAVASSQQRYGSPDSDHRDSESYQVEQEPFMEQPENDGLRPTQQASYGY
ncbi:proton-coupled folate transporter-like [Watersipora subatra]|uniref:proton-coupled folate transporter-like n=1 Tax=Watersipora subatra TaxID=2589382 RepID=UPI00355BCB9D